jgi:hypothetical protein
MIADFGAESSTHFPAKQSTLLVHPSAPRALLMNLERKLFGQMSIAIVHSALPAKESLLR